MRCDTGGHDIALLRKVRQPWLHLGEAHSRWIGERHPVNRTQQILRFDCVQSKVLCLCKGMLASDKNVAYSWPVHVYSVSGDNTWMSADWI